MEGEHEIAGLRFWNGDPTVKLIDADEEHNAMLLERCEPGTPLLSVCENDQDAVIAPLLRRLWRVPISPHPFRPLSAMLRYWSLETIAAEASWPDAGLVREGLALFSDLSKEASTDVLLATDLHAGNVVRASREPWLAIDPKPFVGDRAYDASQHLLNCLERMIANPTRLIDRFADLLAVDRARVRLWTFARAAAEPRDNWRDSPLWTLARALAR
jgi:streptomycin 6-kinase